MKYFLALLLVLGAFFVNKPVYAQSLQPITPTLFCLGSCPTSPSPTIAGQTPTTIPPLSSAPTLSSTPSQTPCAVAQSAVSSKAVKIHTINNGAISQFIQLLLQFILQLLHQLLGGNLQLPTTGIPQPTSAPASPIPSGSVPTVNPCASQAPQPTVPPQPSQAAQPTQPTTQVTPPPSSTTTTNKVVRVGSQLEMNGKPYRMIGLDVPNAAIASWSEPPLPSAPYPYADGSNFANYLAKIRATAPHMNTIWVFALQQFATNNGVRDWSSFDKVLTVANQYGFKVVMNLEDSWSYERLGTHNPALDTAWFNGGYKNSVLTHEQIPYRQWVQEVVTHYKNDPRIAVWQPMAEPNAITLSFAQDISGLVKSIDPQTPISFDEVGPLNSSFYALPGVDIASYHYYSDFGQTNYMAVANAAKAAGKPWVMFEYGINSSVGQTNRANTIKAFLPTMFAAPNASGFLNWQNPPYILNPGDPALPVIDSFAQ